ncbi:MAG: cbb3-type cytochrome c oxidase subunit I [Rickettsiales bacterium]|nr:cbb3-type cytochrome c oxidase subunit I [Pseudomonadota bacterium]MDA0967136.1 cbb3-type cytochrome c oxidase subunit I [Pseudomonadota bacterium]MDG4542378.1 cbb3-type cytochrome c oxidase subunit I [Rickettsiales bacterium]MDG4544882.1 cbb3-type cytochrome c oxidase subunit I [Rickettsiales bacterium]MDG4547005.1 cbb3-type cytochrome c oxidase subunit I [Rickettsiales bacterium]
MTKSLELNIPDDSRIRLIRYWILLAVASLAAAGLYSLPPVILRGSYFSDKFDVEHIFATALVVHVDLSVLVWFLSIAGALWSFLACPAYYKIYRTAFIIATIGAVMIAISPFIGESYPIKNNYVPMLHNPVFIIGLSIFATGILFQMFLTLAMFERIKESILSAGIYISAVITLIAAVCFFIAHHKTPIPMVKDDLHHYYEAIFWGGGHILQYTFTACMLIIWLYIANACKIKQLLPNAVIYTLLVFNLIITIPSPLFYFSDNAYNLFTQQMRGGGGVSALFIGGAIIFGAFSSKLSKEVPHAIKASLILSIILFGYGGILGYMISGVNVTIPAHYHGSIVAVTLAFIAFCYRVLPKVGYGTIKGRLATSQPYIYGIGQILHITGLAWMGGYGALRKSAASSHEITNVFPKLMFFAGGSMAILGGLLFIIVVFRSITVSSRKSR